MHVEYTPGPDQKITVLDQDLHVFKFFYIVFRVFQGHKLKVKASEVIAILYFQLGFIFIILQTGKTHSAFMF